MINQYFNISLSVPWLAKGIAQLFTNYKAIIYYSVDMRGFVELTQKGSFKLNDNELFDCYTFNCIDIACLNIFVL